MGGKISVFGWLIITLLVLCLGCNPKDYSKLPSYSKKEFVQAVIEIPAGTNQKIAYCPLTHRFRIEAENSDDDRIKYLPYPANFGFIPSTRFGGILGKEGDPLDVLVISESLKTGTVIEIIPLALLIMKDDFLTDYKLIAIPADEKKQVVRAVSYQDLLSNYPALTGIIEDWFTHSDQYHNLIVLGWEDEHVARQFIDKWLVDKKKPGLNKRFNS
jgi:inorganic pyrophosphatase